MRNPNIEKLEHQHGTFEKVGKLFLHDHAIEHMSGSINQPNDDHDSI